MVIDPVARTVTHLVIEPRHEHTAGRLVPLRLVQKTGRELLLGCTVTQFERLDRAEESHYVADDDGYSSHGTGKAPAWPYFSGLGGTGLRAGGSDIATGLAAGAYRDSKVVTTDSVPSGDVVVYRGDPVHATDGEIGHIRGIVIDAASHQVTHVILHEGHLFHRKDVAIPIGAVTHIGDTIQLAITRQQVEDLPPVESDQCDQTP
ncbi:PRC-barrel domain-containing protein [Actinoplanes derwentensis]|uniref:PRC-barrel domain-containing protein n=1 Tax=Actinoplanes derwentensis TaxID=113562 RepID=UPI0012FDECFF|nr:PRC-barrel domain-containing protein [Actinoplanes derwentensis]